MKIFRVYTMEAGNYGMWGKKITIGYATIERVYEMIDNFRKEHQINQFWMTYATIPTRDGGVEIQICTEEIEVMV